MQKASLPYTRVAAMHFPRRAGRRMATLSRRRSPGLLIQIESRPARTRIQGARGYTEILAGAQSGA